MENERLALNANPVVAFLQKEPRDFTKEDIINFIRQNNIRMVNFMYPGGDGKLKTLKRPSLSEDNPYLWRTRRRFKSFLFHRGKFQRPIRIAALLHRIR